MPVARIDAGKFWNQKILEWEQDRYAHGDARSSRLEALAYQFSGLPRRMENAQRILIPNVVNRNVVELGCGSGLMAEILIEAGAASYYGVDIAQVAIEKAQNRITLAGLDDKIRFEVGDISSLKQFDADLVFSLGFLDWLEPQQIDTVFRLCKDTEFLHSFSERQFSFWRFIHAAYVYVAYAHRTGSYRPKYHNYEELKAKAFAHTGQSTSAFRDKAMRFGCFITTLSV